MLNTLFKHWLNLLLLLAAGLISLVSVIWLLTDHSAEQVNYSLQRTMQVRLELYKLLASVKEAETGQRGYLLTANTNYLEPYHRGRRDSDQHLKQLKSLSEDGYLKGERLNRLQQLVESKLAELARIIEVRQKVPGPEGLNQSVDLLLTDRGKLLMEQIYGMVGEILSYRDEELIELQSETALYNRFDTMTVMLGAIFTLGTFFAAGYVANLERRQRERATRDLASERKQLSAIVESAMDAIVSVDVDGKIVLFNPIAAQLFESGTSEMVGISVARLVPERYREIALAGLRSFARGEVTRKQLNHGNVVHALKLSGKEFPAEVSISKAELDGQPLLTISLRDVSERESGRQVIREQDAILARIRDPIHIRNLGGEIQFWNQKASRLYGWSPEEAIGRNGAELLQSFQESDDEQILRSLLQEGVWAGERQIRTKQGHELTIESRRWLIEDEFGQPVSQLIIDVDITAELQRKKIQQRSQRLESIGILASGIAHDLNNVLTPITMGISMLLKAPDRTDREQLLHSIRTSTERGAALVKQLVTFAGGGNSAREAVHLKSLIEESVSILKHTLPKNIQIIEEVSPGLSPVIGDATELSQVLLNLAINSRDAMPQGGTISIRAHNHRIEQASSGTANPLPIGDYVCLMISDTGMGIPPEISEKIFDPFFTTKPQGKGTGLGLSTSLGIIQSCGGTILLDSVVGQGSRFSIFLPIVKQAASSVAEPDSEYSLECRGETVLLIDDETAILQMVSAILRGMNYDVLTASRGQQGVEIFESEQDRIDLIIVDMMMPDMDGQQTIEQIRGIDPHIPIIASSGLARPASLDTGPGSHQAFLPKPYQETLLFQTIRRLLEQRAISNIEADNETPVSAQTEGHSR